MDDYEDSRVGALRIGKEIKMGAKTLNELVNFNGRLIGLHGAAGSGKDTAADILVKIGWVKIALADPMKRAVKEWFGWDDDVLWGPSERRGEPDRRYPRPKGYSWPAVVPGAMWVPLSVKGHALVSTEDFGRVIAAGPWHRYGDRYAQSRVDGVATTMHEFILRSSTKIDHVNGNGLDNRRTNLREATPTQNAMNASPKSGGSSPFKGVHYHAARSKWCAQITIDGKTKHLGLFEREIDAAMAYDAAARYAFKEFARLNTDHFLTPRFALQMLGTEIGRVFYEDTWINYALRVARLLAAEEGWTYAPSIGARWSNDNVGSGCRGVVISDVRFPNEAAAIQAAGGRIVAIAGRGGLAGEAAVHASESGIPPELIDVVIDNSGTLEALTMAVERLVT